MQIIELPIIKLRNLYQSNHFINLKHNIGLKHQLKNMNLALTFPKRIQFQILTCTDEKSSSVSNVLFLKITFVHRF